MKTLIRAYPQRSRGVSLIELMVSLVIGSLLILGAVTVYMQSRNTYRTNEASSRLQETARFAMDVIEPDVRMAGYWGMTNRADFIENRGDFPGGTAQAVANGIANNCGTNWTVDTVRFLDGRDNGGYDLGCAGTSPTGYSDVLIVRRASSATSALTANRMQVQANRIRGVIFKDGATPAGFALAPASATHDLFVNAYYISSPAAGQFNLRRQALTSGAQCAAIGATSPCIDDQLIIPGVEDLQVQFGLDINGDNNADQYVNPEAAAIAGAQVVSARIWLRVIAPDMEVGFTDNRGYTYANQNYGGLGGNRRRLVISKTIQLRNSTL